MGVRLARDRFQLFTPCPRRSEDVGPSVPNVNAGGREKTDVLNHLLGVRCELGKTAGCPLLLGREPAPNPTTLEELVMARGKPS